jgi:hypothetical protein
MPNRTQEENEALVIQALRTAGDQGLSLDEIKHQLFSDPNASNSLVKKILERLRSRGYICTRMGRAGLIYLLPPGH